MKLIRMTGFLLIAIFYFSQGTALATDFYGECYGCSYSQQQAIASNAASQYFNANGDGIYRIHIVDLINAQIVSFKIRENDGRVTISVYDTPADVETPMTDFKAKSKDLSTDAATVIIPSTVMDSAWRYPNCAYCANNITDHIRSSLSGRITEVELTIIALAQMANLINTSIPNQYSFPLANGGRVIVELGISADTNLTLVIIDVIDENNNSIPKLASSLRDLQIQIQAGQAEVINGFILQFNFYVPATPTGTVTIRECGTSGCTTSP
ncbi:MAG: hypothetical protein ACI808_001896 [Paraglaciecola sp.]|jgi:hypothetical protein